MKRSLQPIQEIKVIRINNQLRTIRLDIKLTNKPRKTDIRSQEYYQNLDKVKGGYSINKKFQPQDLKVRVKSKTHDQKNNQFVDFSLPRPSKVPKSLILIKANSQSPQPKPQPQRSFQITEAHGKHGSIKQREIHPTQIIKKSNYAVESKDSSTSQSETSTIVWNETYNQNLVESEFSQDLSEQEKFIVLFKYRYEKENKTYLSRVELEKLLKQFGFQFNLMNPEIFQKNYFFDCQISTSTKYKKFFQLFQARQKKNFLPYINKNLSKE